MKKMNNKGFSLVELIVVIAIMAVFVGIAAPQFMGYTTRAKISTDIQNVETLLNAVDVYAAANEETVTDIASLVEVKTADGKTTGVDFKGPATAGIPNITFKYGSWSSVTITYTNGKWVVSGTSADVKGTTYHLDGTSNNTPAAPAGE